jgi:hypothetical protein
MAVDFSCPVSGSQRDNNTARIVAAQVLVLAIITFVISFSVSVTAALIIDGILALDFIIRAFAEPRYSPLALVGRGVSSALGLKKVMVDSAPKIFAARIGLVFTVVSGILLVLRLPLAGGIVLGILAICAFLESVFGFCLGCWMYSLLPGKIAALLVPAAARDTEKKGA